MALGPTALGQATVGRVDPLVFHRSAGLGPLGDSEREGVEGRGRFFLLKQGRTR